jgi:hypothetical protein
MFALYTNYTDNHQVKFTLVFGAPSLLLRNSSLEPYNEKVECGQS